ncbi:hypothetical protein C7974DRAFT_79642 [Boeremia exigua]|uniref:uncharacterized protein n=1 Tax=Boeremia exigua TaxID=749465 RepID=UPI001E8E1123|nr:uncharacterized protein C7974DRAFT_79642 [Boeremia exigua]KAH6612510.1 hypothetical protein C7974DRAFT_79642 [Boeremia exigua]
MPIVGSTTVLGTTILGSTTFVATFNPVITYNASEYSHSTIFVTEAADDASFTNLNAPPLTTYYTPPNECAERWMLAGGQEITTTRRLPTSTLIANSDVAATFPMTSSAALLPRATFVPQNYTVFSLDLNGTATDPSYRSCQPFRLAPTYSPGICPDGQTVAEVTAWQIKAATGHRTFWQASCCRSGMTFGPEFYEACISTFATPLQALALIVTSPSSGAAASTTYEYETLVFVTSASSWSTTTVSSTTLLSTGLAVADPIVVAWLDENLGLFPPEYVASLAARFSMTVPSSTGRLAPPTATPAAGLSSGAKIGIGVGAAVGVLAAVIAGVWLCLKRRRKPQTSDPHASLPEMADQDGELARKKWWGAGKWRSEVASHAEPQELESKSVRVVPGPPAELDGAELQHPRAAGQVVYPRRDGSGTGP